MKGFSSVAFFCILMSSHASAQVCDLDVQHPIVIPKNPRSAKDAEKRAYRLADGSAIVFFGRMEIDADGGPHAYAPNDQGLDTLSNAGGPGNWFGLATDKTDCGSTGTPIVQKDGDPAPGFYVSRTTMTSGGSCSRQASYVDSETIPFVALPPAIGTAECQGRLAVVVRGDRMGLALQADDAPRSGIGEGSIALAKELGIDPDPRRGGTDDRDLIYVVLLTRMGFPLNADEVHKHAGQAFEQWGGLGRANACRAALDKLPR